MLGGRTLLQKFKEQTNAKERVVIIIQKSKRGEVDEMNIEDSCRLILALLKTLLPVHYCCDGFGGKESREQVGFCFWEGPGEREAPSMLESEMASCWPPVRHLSANFINLTYPFFLFFNIGYI